MRPLLFSAALVFVRVVPVVLVVLVAGCHSGPGIVEQALFVPTVHGDVLVTVQRGGSIADEHLTAYSTQTGETLGTRHLPERDDFVCAAAAAGRVWCVSREEPVALFSVPAVEAVAETRQIALANAKMPPIDARAPASLDAATRDLVVQTEGGPRWAIDPRTLAAAPYAGDAASATRVGKLAAGCDRGALAHVGAAALELRGDPQAGLFRDGSPLHPELSFYEGRFVLGDDCEALALDGPPGVVVADEGSSGGGGDFARIGVDGEVVWRSPPFDSPYSVMPAKRERDNVVVVMPHEIAALDAADGRVIWRRAF